jgi:hypothetical protein
VIALVTQKIDEVIKEVGMANRVNKKSRKREKQLKVVKKTVKVITYSVIK